MVRKHISITEEQEEKLKIEIEKTGANLLRCCHIYASNIDLNILQGIM